MKLTKEQIEFLNKVCGGRDYWEIKFNRIDVDGNVVMKDMNLTEIPVKFGRVKGCFSCGDNKLTTLKNCPDYIGSWFSCINNKLTSLDCIKESYIHQNFYFHSNNLTDYFKNIKEKDFPHWGNLYWDDVLPEYPFLINIAKKYFTKNDLKNIIDRCPSTKLYYRD
jgi:hypothetical protein